MRRFGKPPIPGGLPQPAQFSGGTEFIDREGQQLLPTADVTSPTGAVERDALTAPLGEPPVDVDVRSVYDVRPIQAFDVNLPLIGNTPLEKIGPESTLTDQVTGSVPLGYVFVLRRVTIFFSGAIPPIIYRSDALMTLLRNHAQVPYNVLVPVGTESDVDTFTIYDEGEQYGAQITLASTLPDFTESFFNASFYGNFLRKTGRPANQEIGNPVKVPWSKTR